MRNRLIERVVLLISMLKWTFLASIIGVIVGASTALFLKILATSITATQAISCYYYFLLPLALVLSILLVKYLAPEAKGHGTEKVIEAVHKRSGKINLMVVPVKLVATTITIAFGGSVGKEGPCAQIGAGLASFFADIFKFDDHSRKILVICGISAGFAAVFGTPIAGALFGVEVLYIGGLMYRVLLPSFVAGIVSYHVATSLGATYFSFPLNELPVYTDSLLIHVIAGGIFFGFCAVLLIEVLKLFKYINRKIRLSSPIKGLIGGIIIVLLTLIFSKDYLGLGLEPIGNALIGKPVIWYAFLIKIVFTALTLNFGGSGGIITPIFFIGSASGSLFASLFGLNHSVFAAIGMVALLAGAANTPIAASVLAMELFGPGIASYAAIACVTSYLITGHMSVYPSQRVAVSKSESFEVETEMEIESAKKTLIIRRNTMIYLLMLILEKMKNKGTDKEKKSRYFFSTPNWITHKKKH